MTSKTVTAAIRAGMKLVEGSSSMATKGMRIAVPTTETTAAARRGARDREALPVLRLLIFTRPPFMDPGAGRRGGTRGTRCLPGGATGVMDLSCGQRRAGVASSGAERMGLAPMHSEGVGRGARLVRNESAPLAVRATLRYPKVEAILPVSLSPVGAVALTRLETPMPGSRLQLDDATLMDVISVIGLPTASNPWPRLLENRT